MVVVVVVVVVVVAVVVVAAAAAVVAVVVVAAAGRLGNSFVHKEFQLGAQIINKETKLLNRYTLHK
jgi:hypothetical protein